MFITWKVAISMHDWPAGVI